MAKGVAPRVAPLLLLFAAAAEAGRKKEVVEKPLPSVSMQMLDLTLSPLKKLAAAYSEVTIELIKMAHARFALYSER